MRRKTAKILTLSLAATAWLAFWATPVLADTAQPANPAVTIPQPTTSVEQSRKIEKELNSSQPRLQINIPTLKFTDIRVTPLKIGDKEYQIIDIPWLADYIAAIFKYGVAVAALLATVMIMIGGFQYLTAGGDQGRVTKGKTKITDAVLGLAVLFTSYLILNTVNPDLTNLKNLKVIAITRVEYHDVSDNLDAADAATAGTVPAGTALCSTIESCRKFCEEHPYTNSNFMTAFPGFDPAVVPPTREISIPNVINRNAGAPEGMATDALIAALTKAAEIAKEQGYKLYVNNAWRPLQRQFKFICDVYTDPNMKTMPPETWLFSAIARPYSEPHGHAKGISVDVGLRRQSDGKPVLDGGADANPCAVNWQGREEAREYAATLAGIMCAAGFKRFTQEIWHFDLANQVKNDCCNCPFPPPLTAAQQRVKQANCP